MPAQPAGRRMFIVYVALYLAFASAAARGIMETENANELTIMLVGFSVYLLSLLATPWSISQNAANLHLINALQTVIPLAMLLIIGNYDYFSLLFIPPCTQSILIFKRKTALTWIGVMIGLMLAALLVKFPFEESIGFVIIYPAAIFLFTALSYFAMQAQEAQTRSEALLVDLQQANQQLRVYAAQVQELAVLNERNRLARELHDSVTQTIFGLTLSAQAARILIDRNPARAVAELDHLQSLAQNALAEMRALVQELHPHSGADQSLSSLLRRLVEERRSNDGLEVDLRLNGERRLPANVEAELFRIAQEALNNVVKHAHAGQAVITLDLEDTKHIHMKIEDAGVGFDLSQASSLPGHLGLTSMHERVQALGGTLHIDSQPGQGTRLQVELELKQEGIHD